LHNGKKVEGLTFEGEGCAISLASASIMTELVKGKSFEEIKEIMDAFLNMIKNTSEIQTNHLDEDEKTKLMSLSGVKKFPMRVKCATLSWHTLNSAIKGKKEEVNTEAID
jgi:nitrogen fixation NifU-like protein